MNTEINFSQYFPLVSVIDFWILSFSTEAINYSYKLSESLTLLFGIYKKKINKSIYLRRDTTKNFLLFITVV